MKTFPRVVELLQGEVDRTGSVNAVVKRTELTHNTINNYLAGRAEPTQQSLVKIGNAYGKTVAWLRGDTDKAPQIPETMVDMSLLSPTKKRLWKLVAQCPETKAKALLNFLES